MRQSLRIAAVVLSLAGSSGCFFEDPVEQLEGRWSIDVNENKNPTCRNHWDVTFNRDGEGLSLESVFFSASYDRVERTGYGWSLHRADGGRTLDIQRYSSNEIRFDFSREEYDASDDSEAREWLGERTFVTSMHYIHCD